MYRHVRHVAFALFLALGICGCSSPTFPTSPSAPPTGAIPPAAPGGEPPYNTLSGVVSEVTPTGQVPVEGVELYCDSCGSPVGHTSTSTDANGFYSFAWTQNGVHPLLIRKAGYDVVNATNPLADGRAYRNATVNGDTRFDIQVVRR